MNEKRIEELIDHIQRFFDEKFYPGEAAAIRFALRQCARECYEEAAKVIEGKREFILAQQSLPPRTETHAAINQNLRMVAVMLPDLETSIRALKESVK